MTKCIVFSYEASDDRKDSYCQAEPRRNLYERRRIVFGNDELSHSRILGSAVGEILDTVKN